MNEKLKKLDSKVVTIFITISDGPTPITTICVINVVTTLDV